MNLDELIKTSAETFWCPEPYMTLEQKTFGNYGVCCRSQPLPYTTLEKTIAEHFNSSEMQELRTEMESGVVGKKIGYYCKKCIVHEKSGVFSKRQRRIQRIRGMLTDPTNSKFIQGLKTTVETGIVDLSTMGVFSLEFKFFGNLCNLNCLMCHPLQSSSIAKEWKDNNKWDGPTVINLYKEFTTEQKETFYNEIRALLPNTLQVKFTGGEPMMNKDLLDLINFIVKSGYANNITLRVVTNGTIVPERFTKQVKHFKQFICQVSVDGVWAVNDYQRAGSKFDVIDANIDRYKALPNTRVSINSAITALNCGYVDELYLYAKHKEIDIDLTSVVLTPTYLMPQVLPTEVKQKYVKKLLASEHKVKYVNVINALTDVVTLTPTDQAYQYARLINRLEEHDNTHNTNYKDIIKYD